MGSGEVQAVADRILEKLAAINEEREKLLAALEVLQGEGAQVPDGAFSATTRTSGESNGFRGGILLGGRRPEVRPDSYFGLSQHEGAKKYLSELGHADHIDNIFKALTQGGLTIGGARPVETLRATLRQNTKVFVRVGESTFGLRAHYPHLREKKSELMDASDRARQYRQRKAAKGKRGRPKKEAAPKKEAEAEVEGETEK
jgi:hypothetical protein